MVENTKDKWWGWLVLIHLIAIIVFGAYALYTGKNLTSIDVVLTVLVMRLGTLLEYRYGNSRKDKTGLSTNKETE